MSAEDLEVTLPFDSAEHYTEWVQAIVAPIVAMISTHPEDTQRQAWDAITEAARERVGADGRISFENQVLIASGQA